MTVRESVHHVINEGLKGRARIAFAWVFSIGLILSANRYPNLLGVGVCFLGATLRFWASGFLRKDQKLSVGGPYGIIRNPLYFGTFLLGVGTAISLDAWLLVIASTALFFFIYDAVMGFEEGRLQEYFGDTYRKYCALVPRIIPGFNVAPKEKLLELNANPDAYRFSLDLALKNKAYESYFSFVGLVGGVALLFWIKSQFV